MAIVGFGLSGLATLMALVRSATQQTVAVIAPDHTGLGLAYGTLDPSHLLNVPADRMGAWADDPGDFAAWMQTRTGVQACESFGVSPVESGEFVPRMLYARYLGHLRDRTLRTADAREMRLRWIPGCASDLTRSTRGWTVRTEHGSVHARACVLSTGNDPRRVFGALEHADLHHGPWKLGAVQLAHRRDPVVLIGSGLTAVDAVLSLRREGYDGEIFALSRNGLLPRAHRHDVLPFEVEAHALSGIRTPSDVARFISDQQAEGHDWRAALDALRPHTAELWQGLSAHQQRIAVASWSSIWSVHRHRMAPEVARRIHAELGAGRLRVIATRRITPEIVAERLELEFETREGVAERLRTSAVIDCTGPELDCTHSRQTLLRGLIENGICMPHHTGLGLAATGDHQVAEGLYALGALLTGQLWETVAVPELRAQAAVIAAHATGSLSAAPRVAMMTARPEERDGRAVLRDAGPRLRARGSRRH